MLRVAAVLLVLCCLADAALCQEKPEPGQVGRKQEDGTIIMPESAPPTGDRMVTNAFLVDITSIDVKETAAGPTFVMKGISKFPDGTMVLTAIRFYEVVLPHASKHVPVKDGRFEAKFEASKLWAGKRFFPGNYELEAEVSPGQQGRRVRKKIKEELGAVGLTRHYRNKYVTVGTRERMKEEEDGLRDYYLNAIKALWGRKTLFDQLEEKNLAASARFRKKFRKLDKNDNPQIDPNNKNAYLVDDKEFRKYLRKSPNEFYDRTGKFQEQVWRNWLDSVWRVQWQKIYDNHQRVKGNYAAIAYPEQHKDMEKVLKMVKKRSAEHSIRLYTWNNLPLNEKDKLDSRRDDLVGVPGKTAVKTVNKIITDIRYRLRLDEYIEKKSEKDKKDK